MKIGNRWFGGCLAVLGILLGITLHAQAAELPFTWKGQGQVTYLTSDGTQERSFKLELSVDTSGKVTGKTVGDDGSSQVKHLFYGKEVEYAVPGSQSRKTILVLLLNEDGDMPLLAILNGRVLGGRLFLAEASVARYEPGSDTAKALGVGNPVATEIDEEMLSADLKTALRKAMPIGMVKIEGGYTK